MSFKAKFAVAFGVSLLLVGGLFLLFLRGPRQAEGPRGREARPSGPVEADPALRLGKAPPPRIAALKPEQARKKPGEPVAQPIDPALLKDGWTLSGRIVREAEAGGEAAAEAPAAAAGVVVHLKPHPRRTKPEEAPPPRKVVTGPDGKFEFPGVKPQVWLRIEIDEPSSAYRTLSFSLPPPDVDNKRDLGDLPIEPGADLVVQVVGPKDEPVEKATVLVNKDSAGGPSRSDYLRSQGFTESRREAVERKKGEYLLERGPVGPIYVEATAAGYASSGHVTAEMPRAEPLVIRLAEGSQIAGTVLSSDEQPIAGAEMEAHERGIRDPHKAKSDAAGHFAFTTLGEGEFEVVAAAEGFVSARKPGVQSGAQDLTFSLEPEAVFAGKIAAEDDGSPIAKAKVNLRAKGRSEVFSADSDKTGLFKVKKVPAGTYTVTADHTDFAPLTLEPRPLESGEKVEGQDLRLKRGLTITGKVLDSQSQAALADAQVAFRFRTAGQDTGVRKSGKTGEDGTFEVKGFSEGTYTVSVSAKGYFASKSRSVSISAGGEKAFTFTLEQGSSIAGRVLDAAGNPVAGASVRPNIARTSGMVGWNESLNAIPNVSAQSDAEGRYLLEGLPPFEGYGVVAAHRDFAAAAVKGLSLAPREALEGIDLRMARGGTVRGRVLDEQGQPVPGATVSASADRNDAPNDENPAFVFGYSSGSGSATSGADGSYTVPHLEAGSYTLRAQSRDRAPGRREKVQVLDEGTAEGIDITLGAGEVVAGRVVDGEGNPIAGADINLYGQDGQGSANARSDAEGKFKLKGLGSGRAWINASKRGFEGQGVQVEVPRDDVLVTLNRTGKIVGNLRGKGLETFPSFQIMAEGQRNGRGQSSFQNSFNDASGHFEIDVAPGSWVLWAMVPGYAPSRSVAIVVGKEERKEGVVIDIETGATIRGVVAAAGTGQAIGGATVSYTSPAGAANLPRWGLPGATSEADGTFTLEGVPEGTVNVVASHPKYAQGTLAGITVRSGQVRELRIELSGGGGVRGTVTKAGVPATGARVNAFRQGDEGFLNKDAVVNAQGKFEILGLAPGEYMVSVWGQGQKGGNFRAQERVTVLEGQVAELNIAEGAGIRLYGRVTSGGSPVSGGSVMAAQPERSWNGGQATLDGSGFYSMELPGPGRYFLFVQWKAGADAGTKVAVTIPEGVAEFPQDIELPSGEISGVVVDAETGAPVVQAQVGAFAAGPPSRSFLALYSSVQSMTQSDDRGRFAVSNVPAGSYSVRVFAEGYADARLDGVEVEDGGSSPDHRIALERGLSLQVRVVNGRGQPVAQAMALLRDSKGELVQFGRPSISSADGLLEVRGVLPGAYQLTVVHQSYAPGRSSVRVAPDAETPTITLKPGGKVQVQVTSQKSRPVEGAQVEILNERGENVIEETMIFAMGREQASLTRTNGSLVLDQVAPGTYRAVARKGNSRSREERLSIAEGEAAEVRLTLPE